MSIRSGLCGFEDGESFTQWLIENPCEKDKVTIHFIEIIELLDLDDDDCLDLATLVDDIFVIDVYDLEIDGTQIKDLDIIIKEEIYYHHHYIFNKHQMVFK